MKFLSFLKSKTSGKSPATYFLALQIGSHTSKAAVWIQKGEEVEIRETVKGNTPEHVIRKAKESHPLSQVIFGLPDTYVDGEKIRDEKLPHLKQIAESFSLTPLGFVVVPEAIAHFMGAEDGAPPTAILLGIEQDTLTFSLFRVGTSAKTVHVTRTDSFVENLESGIKQFTAEEILPSKIVLYGEEELLEGIKEELLAYPWQDNEKFLHVPKIEVLPWEYSIEAVVHAGVSEMGSEPVLTMDTQQSAPEIISDEESVSPVTHETEELEPSDPEKLDSGDDMPVKTSAAALGFTTAMPATAAPAHPTAEPAIHHQPNVSPPLVEAVPRRTEELRKRLHHLTMPTLPRLAMPKLPALPSPHGLLPAAAIGVLIIAFLAGTVLFYPKATITLLAEPKVLEEEVTLKLNTSLSDIDIGAGEIPGKVYSVTVTESQNTDTTGTKTIGEKATGTIALINKSTSEKSFNKGTVLGTSDISFTLDEDVKIASASDTGESLEYGKATTKATATKIGPVGNIESDMELTVDNISKSSAVARSQEKFSGGTEREINIVAKEDQESLLTKATGTLKDKAREQLSSQLGSDEKFLDESIAENIVEKKFNADVGDETEALSLDLVLEISQTSYKVDDINRFLEGYMKEQMEEGFRIDTEKSFFRVTKTEEDENGNIIFTANYHAFLLPEVTLDGFTDKVAGVSTEKLTSLVNDLTSQNVVGYEITNSRSLPFFGSRMPLLKRNITVEVEMYE
ncbi:MAG: baseplate J/gp47 family protein [Candidatus Roizmanbacteria bacterium]|nr:baseplate J/gp47 family protein [Candidatus Roizmanbacteria bacterium]